MPPLSAISDVSRAKTINLIAVYLKFLSYQRELSNAESSGVLAESSRTNLIFLTLWERGHQLSGGRMRDQSAKDRDEIWHVCFSPGGERRIN